MAEADVHGLKRHVGVRGLKGRAGAHGLDGHTDVHGSMRRADVHGLKPAARRLRPFGTKISSIMALVALMPTLAGASESTLDPATVHREVPDGPFVRVDPEQRITAPARRWTRNGHTSIQVNVDARGNNIVGDAGNEPSIAVDPNDPTRLAIGWRQFDTVLNSFRQAGWGYSDDGGQTWTTSVIEPGIFRSDPVLTADSDGNFYYYSLSVSDGFSCETFKSTDGGMSWGDEVFAFGGDKAWLSADTSGGVGDGNLYGIWSPGGCCGDQFNRSSDGGQSFEMPILVQETPIWGVTAVGPEGEVYVAGRRLANSSQAVFARSTTIRDPGMPLAFDLETTIDLGGAMRVSTGPNPGGLLGQVWTAAGPAGSDEVYVLCSVDPPGADPLDVHFLRSADRGATWSTPMRVNDDVGTDAWQWFGTMSVAPNGRIDAIWNDTREDPEGFLSELYYTSSTDGGVTWSPGKPVSPAFDPHLGWPQQNKIGDYYDMVSDDAGAHITYSATFNGEQDVYYLRLLVDDSAIFADGFESGNTSAWTSSPLTLAAEGDNSD